MHVGNYLALLRQSEQDLVDAFSDVAAHHADEPDVAGTCHRFARESATHAERLAPLASRYGEQAPDPPENLKTTLFHGARSGGMGLLRDLHDLWLLAHEVQLCWTVLRQAGAALRAKEMLAACG